MSGHTYTYTHTHIHTHTHTHTHTYTHDNYYNPRCAHAHRGLIILCNYIWLRGGATEHWRQRGMTQPVVELLYEAKARLGEAPFYDHVTGELIWVDIFGRTVNFLNVEMRQNRSCHVSIRHLHVHFTAC